ncbi:MAG: hypothetical protein ACLQIQ_03235 [Beijerinckiaceae bacterium]
MHHVIDFTLSRCSAAREFALDDEPDRAKPYVTFSCMKITVLPNCDISRAETISRGRSIAFYRSNFFFLAHSFELHRSRAKAQEPIQTERAVGAFVNPKRDEEKWNAARRFRRDQVHADCVKLIAHPAPVFSVDHVHDFELNRAKVFLIWAIALKRREF